jgi:phage tail sheath protein FI
LFVEERPSAARSIEAAGTSTTIFVGETERGPTLPTKIRGRLDYERLFGGYFRFDAANPVRLAMRYAMDAYFGNGGSTAYVLRALDPTPGAATHAARTDHGIKIDAASPGAWGNRLSVLVIQLTDPERFRFVVMYQPPELSTPRIVETWDKLSKEPNDENYVVDVLSRSQYIRWPAGVAATKPTSFDPVLANASDATILGAYATGRMSAGLGGDAPFNTGQFATLLSALDEITDAAILSIPESQDSFIDAYGFGHAYVQGRRQQDLFFIGDLQRRHTLTDINSAVTAVLGEYGGLAKSDFTAVYWPWVQVTDPVGAGKDPTRWVSPSAFAAGLYARTDARRGVWKSPAGVDATLLGIRRLEWNVLDGHQDDLNPPGVNALRMQPSAGPVIWGARTTKPSSEWRYIAVRRTAMFLRKSIYNGIQWAVFEPNDEPLWASLRLTIGSFMDQLFRQGAFAGKTSRDAYYVKCDAETTTEADRIAGVVNIYVGFAPLRPAEFVVVKLSQIVNQKA